MKPGIDHLLGDGSLQKELRGRRLALLAHPASVTDGLGRSLDALMELPARFHDKQQNERAAPCRDCHSTQVFEKFIAPEIQNH